MQNGSAVVPCFAFGQSGTYHWYRPGPPLVSDAFVQSVSRKIGRCWPDMASVSTYCAGTWHWQGHAAWWHLGHTSSNSLQISPLQHHAAHTDRLSLAVTSSQPCHTTLYAILCGLASDAATALLQLSAISLLSCSHEQRFCLSMNDSKVIQADATRYIHVRAAVVWASYKSTGDGVLCVLQAWYP